MTSPLEWKIIAWSHRAQTEKLILLAQRKSQNKNNHKKAIKSDGAFTGGSDLLWWQLHLEVNPFFLNKTIWALNLTDALRNLQRKKFLWICFDKINIFMPWGKLRGWMDSRSWSDFQQWLWGSSRTEQKLCAASTWLRKEVRDARWPQPNAVAAAGQLYSGLRRRQGKRSLTVLQNKRASLCPQNCVS